MGTSRPRENSLSSTSNVMKRDQIYRLLCLINTFYNQSLNIYDQNVSLIYNFKKTLHVAMLLKQILESNRLVVIISSNEQQRLEPLNNTMHCWSALRVTELNTCWVIANSSILKVQRPVVKVTEVTTIRFSRNSAVQDD